MILVLVAVLVDVPVVVFVIIACVAVFDVAVSLLEVEARLVDVVL